MDLPFRSDGWPIRAIALFAVAVLNHCVASKQPIAKPAPANASLANLLNKKGVYAEDSLYACMLNLYYQGFSLDQARDECATKLLKDDNKGFETPLGNIGPGSEKFFDPAKITAACNSGDPRRGQNSSGIGYWPGKGEYTWGGDSRYYYGYAKEDSYKMKEEAVKEWKEAKDAFWKAEDTAEQAKKELDDAKKSGDKEKVKAAQEKYDKAYQEAQKKAADALAKSKKADEDPNKKPPNTNRTVEGETPCEQALQEARELLQECQRTRWKDTRCQQLQARMNHCPDPVQILVDPEQGYTCGPKVDAEAVKNAWVARCEELKRYGPDGDNPCLPPQVDNPGRYIQGKMKDICHDPRAYIDPGSSSCQKGEVELQPFGQPDINQIIVYGLNKFGGPIIVIPSKDPKPPRGGPDPRPGPHP